MDKQHTDGGLGVLPRKSISKCCHSEVALAFVTARSCVLHCKMPLWQVLIKLYLCRTQDQTKSPDSNILFTNISIWSNQNSCKTTSYLPFLPPLPGVLLTKEPHLEKVCSFKKLPVGGAGKFSQQAPGQILGVGKQRALDKYPPGFHFDCFGWYLWILRLPH